MIRVNDVFLPLDYDNDYLVKAAAKKSGVCISDIQSVTLNRRSVDARNRHEVKFLASLNILKKGEQPQPFCDKPSAASNPKKRVIVVGAGPAGLFCAYTLARAGIAPLVIERGEPVEQRVVSVARFWDTSELNTRSNVQFGEGGAGTFSDGKLNTGIKDSRIQSVLHSFVEFGAPDEILWQAKPHIGTDLLRQVVINMRRKIISLGGEFRYNSTLVGIQEKSGCIRSVTIKADNVYEQPCDALVLCIGHSSRDTIKMLLNSGINMQQKPFAMGVRIEHSQQAINQALYGKFANHPALSAADYKLATHLDSGRGVYSFCMCPGGYVVGAASEQGGIAVNGMSNFAREGKNANSAILVGVEPSDFGGSSPLAGIELQRSIEQRAFTAAGGNYNAPVQTLRSFIYDDKNNIGNVLPTYRPGVVQCDISGILPKFITDSLRAGIMQFDSKLRGFAEPDAVLTAPETRSSSPVRILRNELLQANISGVYPCGEGAGYAGGITSSAVDGIKCAEMIIK